MNQPFYFKMRLWCKQASGFLACVYLFAPTPIVSDDIRYLLLTKNVLTKFLDILPAKMKYLNVFLKHFFY